MPITINGTGSITGISAGGLPDLSITTADIADNAVTYAKIGTTEQGQLCKAWVNFNGTGVVAIRAQYNVSSITDNGVGDYTVNFTTAMPDANYSMTFGLANNDNLYLHTCTRQNNSTTNVQVVTKQSNLSGSVGFVDYGTVCVAIFR